MAKTADPDVSIWRAQLKGRAGVPIQEAAVIIGDVHETTVRRLVAAGELEWYHVGRHPRITTESLIAFLERGGCAGATSPTTDS